MVCSAVPGSENKKTIGFIRVWASKPFKILGFQWILDDAEVRTSKIMVFSMDFEGLDNRDNPHPQGERRGPNSKTIVFTMNLIELDNKCASTTTQTHRGREGEGPF